VMSALEHLDDPVLDPDTLKVPENPRHRSLAELIALVGGHLLGAGWVVYRDMNWYPPDDLPAVAPDVMVLPAGTLGPDDRSYRQPENGPTPPVVVEIPSRSDDYLAMIDKVDRYRALGTTVYIVGVSPKATTITRQSPNDPSPTDWTGQPIPELGDLRLTGEGRRITAHTPSGDTTTSPEDWIAHLHHRADTANQRAEALEAQLRSLGIDPTA